MHCARAVHKTPYPLDKGCLCSRAYGCDSWRDVLFLDHRGKLLASALREEVGFPHLSPSLSEPASSPPKVKARFHNGYSFHFPEALALQPPPVRPWPRRHLLLVYFRQLPNPFASATRCHLVPYPQKDRTGSPRQLQQSFLLFFALLFLAGLASAADDDSSATSRLASFSSLAASLASSSATTRASSAAFSADASAANLLSSSSRSFLRAACSAAFEILPRLPSISPHRFSLPLLPLPLSVLLAPCLTLQFLGCPSKLFLGNHTSEIRPASTSARRFASSAAAKRFASSAARHLASSTSRRLASS